MNPRPREEGRDVVRLRAHQPVAGNATREAAALRVLAWARASGRLSVSPAAALGADGARRLRLQPLSWLAASGMR